MGNLRKRWAQRQAGSGAEDEVSHAGSGSLDLDHTAALGETLVDCNPQDELRDDPVTPSWLGEAEVHAEVDEPNLQLVPFLHAEEGDNKRAKYTIVDRSASSVVDKDSIAHVRLAVPDVVEKEAVRLAERNHFRYPWERGRLSKIFGSGDSKLNLVPKLQPSAHNFVKLCVNVEDNVSFSSGMEVSHPEDQKTLYLQAVKAFHGGSYLEERGEKRTLAVKSWWELISSNLHASDPGRTALSEVSDELVYTYGKDILDACVALRSPNTLLKRFYSLKSFADWTIAEGLGPWLPLAERVVWKYLQHLQRSGAAATKASSLLNSIRFGHFLLKLDGAESVLSSMRLRGLSSQLFTGKKPWRPSDPLTVRQVIRVHQLLENPEANLTDRVFAGHILHLAYSRSRWSDLLAVGRVHLDEPCAYLEAEAWVHKTAKTSETKSKLLPIVAPAVGVVGKCWAATYLEVRRAAGLTLPQEQPGPMIVAPSRYGADAWTKRYLTSSEGSKFMKVLFKDDIQRDPCCRITSHSCKATGLSWCAKFGTSDETRAVLGRHSTVLRGSTAIYSRDIVSSALRSFELVIQSIRESTFNPDAGRSGMITPKPVSAEMAPSTPGRPVESKVNLLAENPERERLKTAAELSQQSQQRSFEDGAIDVKQEAAPDRRSWPKALDDAGEVFTIHGEDSDEQNDLLEERLSSSTDESESDGSSSSEGSAARQNEQPEVHFQGRPEGTEFPLCYINTSSLVLHSPRNGEFFKCGRRITKSYTALNELNGLRCGNCFAR